MNFRYCGIFWSRGPEHQRAEYPKVLCPSQFESHDVTDATSIMPYSKLMAAKWAVFTVTLRHRRTDVSNMMIPTNQSTVSRDLDQ